MLEESVKVDIEITSLDPGDFAPDVVEHPTQEPAISRAIHFAVVVFFIFRLVSEGWSGRAIESASGAGDFDGSNVRRCALAAGLLHR